MFEIAAAIAIQPVGKESRNLLGFFLEPFCGLLKRWLECRLQAGLCAAHVTLRGLADALEAGVSGRGGLLLKFFQSLSEPFADGLLELLLQSVARLLDAGGRPHNTLLEAFLERVAPHRRGLLHFLFVCCELR